MLKKILLISENRENPRIQGGMQLGGLLAFLIGVAIPLTALGKATLAFSLIPAVLIAIFILTRRNDWKKLFSYSLSPLAACVALTFAFWAISVLGSLDISRSFEVWSRSLVYVILMIVLSYQLRTEPPLISIVQKSLIVASGIMLLFVLYVIFWDNSPLLLLQALGSSKYQANTAFKAFASTMACLLPTLLWSGIQLGRSWLLASAMMVPGTLMFIWGSQSKAATLGLLVAFLLVVVTRLILSVSKQMRHVIIAILAVTTLFSTAVLLVRLPSPPITNETDYRLPTYLIDRHRQAIWGFVFSKFKEKPWLGHGIDIINQTEGASVPVPDTGWRGCYAFCSELDIYFESAGKSLQSQDIGMNYVPSHPHNWVLEIGAETGLLGLAATVVALLALLRRLSLIARKQQLIGWTGIASFGVFWGSGLTNFSIWASWWQVTFLLIMAILFAAATTSSEAP